LNETPIEKYLINDKEVLVKREDFACPFPGPTFSKVRGLFPYLLSLADQGFKTVGYTETSISMAGWGVSWACKEIGLKAVIFEPVYVSEREDLKYLRFHKEQWNKFGADIIQLKAGRTKVNFYLSKKILNQNYENSIMLPLGLQLKETTIETSKIIQKVQKEIDFDCVVINVGSGTITSGILNGIDLKKEVYGILGWTRNAELKKKRIIEKTQRWGYRGQNLFLIDSKWEYTKPSKAFCPFPSHPYYDLKAWQWLTENIQIFQDKKVLFWNIGSAPNELL